MTTTPNPSVIRPQWIHALLCTTHWISNHQHFNLLAAAHRTRHYSKYTQYHVQYPYCRSSFFVLWNLFCLCRLTMETRISVEQKRQKRLKTKPSKPIFALIVEEKTDMYLLCWVIKASVLLAYYHKTYLKMTWCDEEFYIWSTSERLWVFSKEQKHVKGSRQILNSYLTYKHQTIYVCFFINRWPPA